MRRRRRHRRTPMTHSIDRSVAKHWLYLYKRIKKAFWHGLFDETFRFLMVQQPALIRRFLSCVVSSQDGAIRKPETITSWTCRVHPSASIPPLLSIYLCPITMSMDRTTHSATKTSVTTHSQGTGHRDQTMITTRLGAFSDLIRNIIILILNIYTLGSSDRTRVNAKIIYIYIMY